MNRQWLVILAVLLAAAPDAVTAACDTLQTCYLRNLASGVEVNLKMTPSYKMDTTNKVGYSIRCTLSNIGTVNYVKFLYNGVAYDAYAEPRWMSYYGTGPNGDYISPIPYLDSCGSKTISVQGHTWETKCFDQTFTFAAQCGSSTDKAPAPKSAAAPAPQPVSVAAQPTAMAGTCDALTTCYLRNINAKTEIDLSKTTTYALDLINKDKNCYSIRCETKKSGDLNFIKFSYDGTTHDSFDEPRWMSYYGSGGANGDYVEKVPYLGTCGTKTVKVSGQTWSRVCFEKTLTLTASCGPTAPAAPKAVDAPKAQPQPQPVTQPQPSPKTQPQPTPASVPTPTTTTSSSSCAATVQSCVVRNLATKMDVNVLDSSSYPVDPNNKAGYSLLCKVAGSINLVKYLYDNQVFDAFAEPRWMSYYGNSGSGGEYIAPVPYLATCGGTKTIKVQGHTWNSLCVEKVLTLTATCNGVATTPAAAPTLAATPPVAPRDKPSSPACRAGYKMVSNACVKDWCESDYVCPPGSGRIPDRECYNDKKDCACLEGYVSRLGICLKSRLSRSCPNGRYWWGSCKRQTQTVLRPWNPFAV
jgi:hypothetical protein